VSAASPALLILLMTCVPASCFQASLIHDFHFAEWPTTPDQW
jgi:hypothetical protein